MNNINTKLNNTEFTLDEIESIELIGDAETIDITVADVHMFYANEIYTHNSSLDHDIIEAGSIADSYKKIMTSDFVMSVSRKVNDKVSNTARVHVMKNRFGPDGITYPTRMNAGNGDIQIFHEDSREGVHLTNVMNDAKNDSANSIKDSLRSKWNAALENDEI